MTQLARQTEAARRSPRLFKFIRVRISRKLWGTYRVRLCNIVSRVLGSLLIGIGLPAGAAPIGGQVVSGQAQISTPSAQSTVVNQATPKAVINWQSFGIAGIESVQFVQPSATSVVLNRIVGNDASRIFGSLTANGQVFLINPQGVYFAPAARVETGALLASSLALSDADFSAGRYRLGAAGGGDVRNEGRISVVPGGYVVLAAPQVTNSGAIVADNGTVVLLVGSRLTVDVAGDRLISYSIDEAALRASVVNSGSLQANGGAVSLLASTLGGALATAVNHSGVIRANSVAERNGVVTLRATGGDTVVTGGIDVSGARAGQTGGSVSVLGDRVGLFDQAVIDATGAAGGGTVHVGGGYQGQGEPANANKTVVGPQARIDASATGAGKGGSVVVWSDDSTHFSGTVAARGGAIGGDGGQVETSGKRSLTVLAGSVDVAARKGRSGTWLLDPNDLTIKSNAGANTNIAGTFDTSDDTAVLDTGVLGTALSNGTAVVVRTTSSGANTQSGDITVQDTTTANLAAAESATLTLAAQRNIIFTAGSSITSGGADRSLSVNLHAGTDAAGANPGTNLSTVTMDPTSAINAGLAGSVAVVAKGNVALGQLNVAGGNLTVTTNGGNVSQAAAASVGLLTSVSAGAGTVTLDAATNQLTGAIGSTGSGAVIVKNDIATVLCAIGTAINPAASLAVTTTTNQALTQSADVFVAGATTVSTGTGNITLNRSGNDFQGTVSLTGGAIDVGDINNLNLIALANTPGSAVTAVEGGTLTLPAVAISTGLSSLELRSNAGVLNTAAALSGTAVTLFGSAGVGLGHNVTATGNLSLGSTNSPIAQTAGVLDVALATTVAAGTGAVTLGSATNRMAGAISSTGSGALIIKNDIATVLGAIGTAINPAASLSVTTTNDAVTQTAAANVAGPAVISTGAGSVNLTQPGNDFQGQVTVTASGNANVVDANALTVAFNGTVATTATAGGALVATLSGTGATSLSAASVITSGSSASLGIVSGSTTAFGTTQIGGALTVTGVGDVSQTGALTVGTTSNINSTTGSITLANANNDFIGAVTAIATAAGKGIAVVDKNDLTIALTAGGNGSATAVAGNLAVSGSTGAALTTVSGAGTAFGTTNVGTALSTSAVGDVTQGGALTVGTTSNINSSAGAINLVNTGNDFIGPVTASAPTASKSITVVDKNDLTIALTAGGSGSASALAGGLGVSGSTGTALTTLSTVGKTTFGMTTVGTTLRTTAGGDVSQSGPLTVQSTSVIIAPKTGAITLDNVANKFVGEVAATANTLSLTTSQNAELNITGITSSPNSSASITTGGAVITLNGSYDGRSLTLTSTKTAPVPLFAFNPGKPKYALGSNVQTVTTKTLNDNPLNHFQAASQDTVFDNIAFAVRFVGDVLGGTSAGILLAEQERRERERSAGIGRLKDGVRQNSIRFEDLIAPLAYRNFEARSAPCAKEQAANTECEK